MKEYILPKNSMIGGWYISSTVCDNLVNWFKENKEHHVAGVVGPPSRVDPNEKMSTEFCVHQTCNHPTFLAYQNLLKQVVHLYEEKYPEVKDFNRFGMVDSCQIQWYKPNEGFKKWHFERGYKEENRCLVFMTYLNTTPDAGTMFKYQQLTTPCENGLTLIFPPDFTHTHKGQITDKNEKYIITGWLGYI